VARVRVDVKQPVKAGHLPGAIGSYGIANPDNVVVIAVQDVIA